MIARPPNNNYLHIIGVGVLLSFLCQAVRGVESGNIVLHLKNGDRVAGRILSENTNQVVLATSWIASLPIPTEAIARRETSPAQTPRSETKPPPATATVVKPASTKRWSSKVMFGADLLLGARVRELYYSRIKLAYEQPYQNNPKEFFRTLLDYSVDYGETDGARSANRMDGTLKTDFDLNRRLYLYGSGSGGYDETRKIDLRHEIGPGLGHHLISHPKFQLNAEAGANHQLQDRSEGLDTESLYVRAAQDMTWKITERLACTQKFEFFNNIDDMEQFRFRLDSTLSYAVWRNVSLNLTVLDVFDTDPAPNVDKNEFQMRSSLGLTF